jgi:hypothetical protein
VVIAAVVAAVLAVPAGAVSHRFAERGSATTVDPGLSEYIGRVLRVRAGSSFVTPPRYVDGVRTAAGLVLLWAGRRGDGTRCTGVESASGDPDVVRMKLAGRTIADNGIGCGGGATPLGAGNVGLTQGQGLGGVRVEYGQVPPRVHAVRVSFEDGNIQRAVPQHGWVIVAFESEARRPGHRPILEQALDAHNRPIATKRLNPWEYGGTEPPLPPLDGPGSILLTTVRTASGIAQLRLSAPGRAWQRQECWGAVIDRHSTPILCSYPASFDPATPPPATNNLFLYGPRVPGVVIAIATRADQAWLVSADSVRRGRVVLLTLAHSRQIVVVAATGRGRSALTGIVTSRGGRIVGALLMASRKANATTTAPCFLAAPSAGAPAATPACRALLATAARRAGVSRG